MSNGVKRCAAFHCDGGAALRVRVNNFISTVLSLCVKFNNHD